MARHTRCTQRAKGAGVTAELEEHLNDVHEILGSIRRKQKQNPKTETMYCGSTLGRRQRQEDESLRANLSCLEVHKTLLKKKKKK